MKVKYKNGFELQASIYLILYINGSYSEQK